MEKYGSIIFVADMAFEVKTMEELLAERKAILIEMIDISGMMESSISRLAAIYKKIEVEYEG